MVRPNLVAIDVTAGAGRANLKVGARVRISGTGLYAGEDATISSSSAASSRRRRSAPTRVAPGGSARSTSTRSPESADRAPEDDNGRREPRTEGDPAPEGSAPDGDPHSAQTADREQPGAGRVCARSSSTRDSWPTIAALGYEEPTPIQREAIPPLLAGRDLLAEAPTGTGKTAAFALPTLQRIPIGQAADGSTSALVLVPTRELAMQVAEALDEVRA